MLLEAGRQWTRFFFHTPTNRLMEIPMSKNINDLLAGGSPIEGGVAASDPFMAENFPLLTQLLTITKLANGKTRTPCTLFIFASGGEWKICLTDKDTDRCLWAGSDSVGGLTKALEACLDLPAIPWKAKRFGGRK